MAGPVSNNPPIDPRWQVAAQPAPATPTPATPAPLPQQLDLTLPQIPADAPLQNFTLERRDTYGPRLDGGQGSSAGEYSFIDEQVDDYARRSISRSEAIENIRGNLRDQLGERGALGVELLTGGAYLASGGKLKVTREADFHNADGSVGFYASGRRGGTVGIEGKWTFGGAK